MTCYILTLFPQDGQKLKLTPVERAFSIVKCKFTLQCGHRASGAILRTIQYVMSPSTIDATKKAIFASVLFSGNSMKPKATILRMYKMEKETLIMRDFL